MRTNTAPTLRLELHLESEHPDDRCPWDAGYVEPVKRPTTAQLLEMGHVCRVCARIVRREKPVTAGGQTVFLCWDHKVEFLKALRGDLCVACGKVVPVVPDECCGYLYCSPECLGLHVDDAHAEPCSQCGQPIGPEGFCRVCVVDDRYA